MKKNFFDIKDIKKYGMQVAMLPYIEVGTQEMRYKIIGICNGEQLKISETGKPLQAISELNNYFLKYSKTLQNLSEIGIKKFDEDLISLEDLIKKYDEKIYKMNNIPKREYLETLPMRTQKNEESLVELCKKNNIKGYAKLKKDDIINKIIEESINNI